MGKQNRKEKEKKNNKCNDKERNKKYGIKNKIDVYLYLSTIYITYWCKI